MVAVRDPMSAGLEMVMVTPGKTAPVLSLAVPSTAPVAVPTVWVAVAVACRKQHATSEEKRMPACVRCMGSKQVWLGRPGVRGLIAKPEAGVYPALRRRIA